MAQLGVVASACRDPVPQKNLALFKKTFTIYLIPIYLKELNMVPPFAHHPHHHHHLHAPHPHHGHSHGGHGHGHGPRGPKMFDAGAMRYVVLHLIAQKPRHGYELIKEIEALAGGAYTP